MPVKIIDGEIPSKGGPVVMFTDPIGKPLLPGSVAGVHIDAMKGVRLDERLLDTNKKYALNIEC